MPALSTLASGSRGSGLQPIAVGTMAKMEQYPQELREYKPIQPRGTDWRGFLRKLWAPIAAVGAFLAKFGVALLKFKFLFSMFVSAAVYVWLGGWWFGIGLVVLLFVHEMGHVLEAKRDRKSTRLNSSHLVISYAVFCLQKKISRPPNPPAPLRQQRPHRQPFR